MKVRTLAGARRLVEPAPAAPLQPQYRWTFKTWVLKAWSDHHGHREIRQNERTVTVIAATEEEAKRKIEAAVPSIPQDGLDGSWNKATYKREWSAALGEVVEVS